MRLSAQESVIIHRVELPEEPPIGSVVLDQANGVAWQHLRHPAQSRPSVWARAYRIAEALPSDPYDGTMLPWAFLAPGRILIELYRPTEEESASE